MYKFISHTLRQWYHFAQKVRIW